MSFEKDNEERRKKEELKKNMLKWYGVKCSDEPYYIGSLDLVDPYSGEHIYVPSEQYLNYIDAKERKEQEDALNQSTMYSESEDNTSNSDDNSANDLALGSSDMSEEELKIANEIYERLMKEAAADEMARQAEIDAARRACEEAEAADEGAYNASTGSYSGLYGKKPMSDSEADALASIMNQNSSYTKSIEDLIKENQ